MIYANKKTNWSKPEVQRMTKLRWHFVNIEYEWYPVSFTFVCLRQTGHYDWNEIAAKLGNKRSATACKRKFSEMVVLRIF